jgi:hypothetical protein
VNVQDTLFGDTEPEVRILTVRQPMAWSLIYADPAKDVENRARYVSYRGLLLVHAGQKVDPEGVEFLRSIGIEPPAEAYRTGHIVGSVQVTGCVSGSPSIWARPGAWHIQVSAPEPATAAVMHSGNLGLMKPPAGWERAFSA